MNREPFDPRLPALIAAKLGDPYDLAAYCGMSASVFDRVKTTPAFAAALVQAEKELQEGGYSPEYAELTMLQEAQPSLIEKVLAAFHNPRTTIDQRLKIMEQVDRMINARRARLNPKSATPNGGPGFSITINIPQPDGHTHSVTLQGSPDLPQSMGINDDLEADYEYVTT